MNENTDEKMQINKDYEAMIKDIKNVGGLFYQYRPCRFNYDTIYDIENIKHGVVFAQSPLKMNDPFDSQIGFCADAIYDESINMILEAFPYGDSLKLVIKNIVKNKLFGRFAELIIAINELKKYLLSQQRALHQQRLSFKQFVNQCAKSLYNKCPKEVKTIISRDTFVVFCGLVTLFENIDITEESLLSVLKLDKQIDEFQSKILDLRDNVYIPKLTEFISKLTVSCFSVSGWNNPLMWSHYANSYSGICIEYDFSKIDNFIGFIKKINYTEVRPTISLRDLGIVGFHLKANAEDETKVMQNNPNILEIFKYLLVKDSCWNYEKEWRIINVENESYMSRLIEMQYIKSITFGVNIHPLCKKLLLDVCGDKGIECYDLVLNQEDFNIGRTRIDVSQILYDRESEQIYIQFLANEILKQLKDIDSAAIELQNKADNEVVDYILTQFLIEKCIDFISNSYFLKLSWNRLCKREVGNLSQEQQIIISEAVMSIDKTIEKSKEMISSVRLIIASGLINGLITKDKHKELDKQLATLTSLIDKYFSNEWLIIKL